MRTSHCFFGIHSVHSVHPVRAKESKDVIENRAAYRAMCFSTPGLSEHISGVILHWETLFQDDATGKPMVDIIKGNGMIPGIKVDKGYNKKGMWGTASGPLGHPEVATLGLDDLQQRCAQAYAKGARFAKWRNVLQLDPARVCQVTLQLQTLCTLWPAMRPFVRGERLVPIVEPESFPTVPPNWFCSTFEFLGISIGFCMIL